MNNDNSKLLTFWLLILSLTVLVALSTVILVKTVFAEDQTEVVTTVKSSETPQDGSAAQTSSANTGSTPVTEKPSAIPSEKSSEDPAISLKVEPAETPESTSAPAPAETPAPYTGAPKFENVYYNEDHCVTGQVLGVDPAEYCIVLFIKVDGYYYIKPSWAEAMTYIQDDGRFAVQAYTNDDNRRADQTATEYSIFCVPSDFDPGGLSSFSDVSTVRDASILAAEDLPAGN